MNMSSSDAMTGADGQPPGLLVGELPPPPPHASVFGDHLLATLREGGGGVDSFDVACKSIAPPPLEPQAPLGIFGRIVDDVTPQLPSVVLKPVSAASKLSEIRSGVDEALSIFTKLSPDSCDLELNKAKVAEMKKKFVEMHEVCGDLRVLQGATRVRDYDKGLKEKEEEELENLKRVVKRAKVALGDE